MAYVHVTSEGGRSEGMLSWHSQSLTTCSYITELITVGPCLHCNLHSCTNPPLTLSSYFLSCSTKHALEVWWFLLKFSVYDQQYFVDNGHKLCSLSRPTMQGGRGQQADKSSSLTCQEYPCSTPGYDPIGKQMVFSTDSVPISGHICSCLILLRPHVLPWFVKI